MLDLQCAVQKPKACGKLGKFSDKGGKSDREERKLLKSGFAHNLPLPLATL